VLSSFYDFIISEHRFLHALNYTMILPGPEAQQLATYIGWLMFGVRGGIVAGVLFVLPSSIDEKLNKTRF
jgi:chromate transporter